jgi:hypothetical protein
LIVEPIGCGLSETGFGKVFAGRSSSDAVAAVEWLSLWPRPAQPENVIANRIVEQIVTFLIASLRGEAPAMADDHECGFLAHPPPVIIRVNAIWRFIGSTGADLSGLRNKRADLGTNGLANRLDRHRFSPLNDLTRLATTHTG